MASGRGEVAGLEKELIMLGGVGGWLALVVKRVLLDLRFHLFKALIAWITMSFKFRIRTSNERDQIQKDRYIYIYHHSSS